MASVNNWVQETTVQYCSYINWYQSTQNQELIIVFRIKNKTFSELKSLKLITTLEPSTTYLTHEMNGQSLVKIGNGSAFIYTFFLFWLPLLTRSLDIQRLDSHDSTESYIHKLNNSCSCFLVSSGLVTACPIVLEWL